MAKKKRSKKMKLKSKKGLAKRVKISATGKLMYTKAGRRHLLSGRSKKRKRQLRRKGIISKSDMKGIRFALPYGLK